MSTHTLAILVKATGAAKAAKDLKGVDAAVSRIGAASGKGLRNLTANLGKLGLVVGAGLGVAIKGGIDSLATLESATGSVDAAITQMGLAGKITSGQVAAWANAIEANVGAAFDDKDIVSATTTLIRFGKVTPGNLKPAMVVMTDLAAKTGDVDGAATLLGKALADPTKAAGKLARYGIILTKAEIAQIKAFDKAGKAAEAQAVILAAVERTTKGAAAASQGPYKRAMSVLADVTEDAQRALAEGFLPVIQRVADWLGKKLADPRVIDDIRGLGRSLAGAFDKAVSFVQDIDWGTVKDTMGMVGTGAKMALDAFLAMPSWVQTAVVGGWGLNKLTGGALGDIAGELGKGLIKGILGINAGVVNINAGVVNSGGKGIPGIPGSPSAPGAPGGVPVAAAGGLLAPGIAAAAAAIATPLIMFNVIPALVSAKGGNELGAGRKLGMNDTQNQTLVSVGLGNQIARVAEATNVVARNTSDSGSIARGSDALSRNVLLVSAGSRSEGIMSRRALAAEGQRTTAAAIATKAATITGLAATALAARASAAAIRAKDLSVKITVPVRVTSTVSVRDLAVTQRTYASYAGKIGNLGTL